MFANATQERVVRRIVKEEKIVVRGIIKKASTNL
jgi:hypothetical protein